MKRTVRFTRLAGAPINKPSSKTIKISNKDRGAAKFANDRRVHADYAPRIDANRFVGRATPIGKSYIFHRAEGRDLGREESAGP